MFQGWSLLLLEMWILMILAGMVGLVSGWIIWGRRTAPLTDPDAAADPAQRQITDLTARLERGKTDLARKDARIRTLEADLDGLRGKLAFTADAEPVLEPSIQAPAAPTTPRAPERLDAPNGGQPDDLHLIVGLDEDLARACHSLGIYYFDQIARWDDAAISWIDQELDLTETSRKWVTQAQVLAKGRRTD